MNCIKCNAETSNAMIVALNAKGFFDSFVSVGRFHLAKHLHSSRAFNRPIKIFAGEHAEFCCMFLFTICYCPTPEYAMKSNARVSAIIGRLSAKQFCKLVVAQFADSGC